MFELKPYTLLINFSINTSVDNVQCAQNNSMAFVLHVPGYVDK